MFSKFYYHSKFSFGTKTETLERLNPLLTLSHIPKFCSFMVAEWQLERETVLQRIRICFDICTVIVRSSACAEDAGSSSMAGLCSSIQNIAVHDKDSLCKAIDTVISSYKKLGQENNTCNQVLVQLMIEDVSMSGVLFTQDLNTGAPYYVINYDDETGRTDTITAGSKNSNRTLLVHRDSVHDLRSERFKRLLEAVNEVEKVTGHDSLDIEFALDRYNTVYLFQVRQITTRPNWNRGITIQINDAIKRTQEFVSHALTSKPRLHGKTTIFGRMPDWNPAEMLGTSPRQLALSLYQYLITNYAWREARKRMGYYNPRGSRLMVSLFGQPYIDVRLSFNSFLPADLDPAIGEKLVNAWLERLSLYKELHDKIEFEVAITCLTFDFDSAIAQGMPDVLTDQEKNIFRTSLLKLTNNLLTGKVTSIQSELDKIKTLENRHKDLMQGFKTPELTIVSELLEDCIRLGIIPFSILARHAFIAKSFLHCLVRCGVAEEADIGVFQRSIKTISTTVVNDFDRLTCGEISPEEFMTKYGHLRPGTYDILSKRYDQRDDIMKGLVKKTVQRKPMDNFSFSLQQLQRIDTLLHEFGFTVDAHALIRYIREAIAAREYAKFVFTKNISDALEIIATWGEDIGLSKEELSYLSIDTILDTTSKSHGRTLEQCLRDISCQEKRNHEITRALQLPYLIESYEDVVIVPLLLNKPNFITQKTVKGHYVLLDSENGKLPDIADYIVLIEGADPGFDWIFARSIRGLITKFGGANSHMAIRCAEFGIPAAIGCGEQIFDRILHSRAIEINCLEGRIISIEG
ncbi:MAG: PEP/pyruvate-binding domain-containing protein [bacterium]